jgi:hypothetical protein
MLRCRPIQNTIAFLTCLYRFAVEPALPPWGRSWSRLIKAGMVLHRQEHRLVFYLTDG